MKDVSLSYNDWKTGHSSLIASASVYSLVDDFSKMWKNAITTGNRTVIFKAIAVHYQHISEVWTFALWWMITSSNLYCAFRTFTTQLFCNLLQATLLVINTIARRFWVQHSIPICDRFHLAFAINREQPLHNWSWNTHFPPEAYGGQIADQSLHLCDHI